MLARAKQAGCWLGEFNELDLLIQQNCRPKSVYHYRSIALASSIHVRGVVFNVESVKLCLPFIVRGRFALLPAGLPSVEAPSLFGSLTFCCEGHIMCTFARGHGSCAGAAHHVVSVISRLGSSVIGCSSRA